MKTVQIITAVIALLGGVAGGYVAGVKVDRTGGDEAAPPAVDAPLPGEDLNPVSVTNVTVVFTTNVVETVVPREVENGELADLREQLALARAALTEKEDELAKGKKAQETEREQRRGPEAWRERMERMREEEPERYAEMTKRREEFRARMERSVADRSVFLLDLDTSAMTEEEKASHDELLERIQSTWSIIQNIEQQGFPSREEREVLRDNYGALFGLYATERAYVLRQVGRDLGYDEAGAEDFGEHMQKIIEVTSPPMPRPRGGTRGGSPR